MYCTTCGKQIIDTARFCNYCGSPVAGANFTAPAANIQNSPAETAPVSAPAESAAYSAPVSAPISEPLSEHVEGSGLLEEKKTAPESAEELSSEASGYSESAGEKTQPIEQQLSGSEEFHSGNTQTAAAYGEASAAVPNVPAQTVSNVETPSVTDPVLNAEAANTYSLPAPTQIPVSGEGDVHVAMVPEKPAKPLPERKYTFGHIMMCLGAVAVMAIVAGVFAGLYFSVV